MIVDTDKKVPKAEEDVDMVTIETLEEHLMVWPDEEADAEAAAAGAAVAAEDDGAEEEEESILGGDDDDDD